MTLILEGKAIDPKNPANFPLDQFPWLEAVQKFCTFWFSDESSWQTNTSGSTSIPKTISLSRKLLEFSARNSLNWFGFDPKTVGFALIIPASSAGGFMLLARAFMAEMDVLLLPPSAQIPSQEAFPSEKKWFVPMLPNQFNAFVRSENAAECSRLFTGILLGGGPLETKAEVAMKMLECPVYHSYGMTETASHIALRKIFPADANPPFRSLEGIEIRLNKNDCLEIKASEINNGEWLSSHDVAEIFEGNQFQIIGRADFVVNSGGLKIHPEIVRKLISAHLPPEINDFELLGCPDDILGEKLAIVIFTQKEALKELVDPENWFNAISNPAERRTLPRSIYLMEDIRPILAGGKTDFMFLRKKIEEIVPVWEKPKTKE